MYEVIGPSFSPQTAVQQIPDPGEGQTVSLESMNWRNFRLGTPNKAEDPQRRSAKTGITSAQWGIGAPFSALLLKCSNQTGDWRTLAYKCQSTSERASLGIDIGHSLVDPPTDKCCPHTQYF